MRGLLLLTLAGALAASALGGEEVTVTFTGEKAAVGKEDSSCTFTAEISAGGILAVDLYGSGIDQMIDDQGTDFGTKPRDRAPDYRTQPFYMASTGSVRKTEVTVSALKAAGANAKSVTVEGTLKVRAGRERRAGRLKDLALTKGTAVDLGGIKGAITDVQTVEDATEFTVEFPEVSPELHIEMLMPEDAAGSWLPGGMNLTRSAGEGGKAALTARFYGIRPAQKSVALSYALWTDAQFYYVAYKVTLPVEGAGGEESKPMVTALGAPASATMTTPAPAVPTAVSKVKPVGKFGIQVEPEQLVDEPVLVGFSPPLAPARGEQYIVSLVPLAQPETYWGYWTIIDPKKGSCTLRSPDYAGLYELRLGMAKYPETTYKVIERIKITVK